MAQPELDRLKAELIEAIAAARDLAQLDEVRVKALGKKGRVSELMQTLGAMPPEKRKSFGQAVNALKTSVSEALDARHQVLAGAALVEKLASDRADISLPVREGPLAEGRIHPVLSATFPFERVADAVLQVHHNQHEGKLGVLVLAPDQGLGVTDPELREQHLDQITRFRRS